MKVFQNDGVPVKVLVKMSVKDLNNLVFSMKNAQTVIKIEHYDFSEVKKFEFIEKYRIKNIDEKLLKCR